MKINFDKETNTITIKDDYKRNNIITVASLIFCILASGWNIIRHHSVGFDSMDWFSLMSFILLISAVIYRLSFIAFKTTFQSQFKVSEIEFIKFRRFGKWKYFNIHLRNGKRREVMLRLDQDDYEIMVERCNNFGIEMKHHKNEPSNL